MIFNGGVVGAGLNIGVGRQMEHIVHLLRPEDLVDGGEVRQILLVQLEAGVIEQVGDIGLCADEIVVHADNVVALGQKRVDEVAADESGAAGY